jgi:hypothetical protein
MRELGRGRLRFVQRAGPSERFGRDAFSSQIGQLVKVDGQMRRLLEAVVSSDGASVEFTFDRPEQEVKDGNQSA